MKRGGPLRRGKPLARTGFTRRPVRPAMRRPPAKPHTYPADVEAAVRGRSRGYCEARISSACRGLGQHFHHRKLRAQGGPDTPANLVHVCFLCHVQIHGVLHGRARRMGLLLDASTPDDEIVPFDRLAT